MKVLSLYCGAGGLDEGLRQAGFKTTVAVDIWNDACQTFKLNHTDAEVINKPVGEIKSTFGKFDMVVGGPPCPEFSRAKTGRTLDACEVNNFWEIVKLTGAKYWIMENVQDVIKVCKEKSYLINCADYGVPQTRVRRIFTNLPLPKPTHSEFPTNTLFGEPMKKWVSVKDALGLDGIVQDRKSTFGEGFRDYSIDRPSPTLLSDARLFVSHTGFTHQNKESITRSIDEPSDTIVNASNVQITNYEIKSLKKIRNRNPKMFKKHPPNLMDGPCATIKCKDRALPDEMISEGDYARKLGNAELAILQGFPTNYKWHGNKTSVRIQVGNAVPPPIIKAFGELLSIPQ